MTDEKDLVETGKEVEDTAVDYLATIKQLKENTVERSKYDQLRAENKKLLENIVNGQPIEQPSQVENKPTIEDLRDGLFNKDNTNLEYITQALELRKQLIESGQPDPFLPYGKQIMPTDEDMRTAERVANVLQECVDYAEGDSQVFTNELQRRMVDVKIR